MSSVSSAFSSVPKRQYIATGDFSNDFFTYSWSVSQNKRVYTLSRVTGANSSNCSRGHILRESGRKLFKGVNPSLNDPSNTSKEYTYLVRVFDAHTQLSGFIDPNCQLFAPYNTNKTIQTDVLAEGYNANRDEKDLGPPVYTMGDVATIGGNIYAESGDIYAGAGDIYTGAGDIYTDGSGHITSATYVSSGCVTQNITTNNGGATNFNVYADWEKGNTIVANITHANAGVGTSYVYFSSGIGGVANFLPPAGTFVTVIIKNSTGQNMGVAFNQVGSMVKGYGNVAADATGIRTGKLLTFSFVSDGANLIELYRGATGANGMSI